MSRIEVVPFGPLDGSDGHAFSVRRDGEPVLMLDAGSAGDRPDWLGEASDHGVVWLSHGHFDHAGALPHLLQERPKLQVVLPSATVRASTRLAIAAGLDSARAHAIFDNARAVKFHEPFELAGAQATSGPSGHGQGAGLLSVDFDGTRIGYTGDWALHPRSGAQPASLSTLRDLDLLVCECALSGAARLDDWSSMETISELTRFVSADGPRLLAVSPFAELDEVVSLVRHRDDLVVERGLADFVDDVRLASASHCADHLSDGGLVIAHGSGLRANEPAGQLAMPHVSGPKARIALFNDVPRGTPAASLMATKRRARRTVWGENRRIRAHVRRFDFPTHATRPDLIRALLALAPRRLLLFHQSQRALGDFARALVDAGYQGTIENE